MSQERLRIAGVDAETDRELHYALTRDQAARAVAQHVAQSRAESPADQMRALVHLQGALLAAVRDLLGTDAAAGVTRAALATTRDQDFQDGGDPIPTLLGHWYDDMMNFGEDDASAPLGAARSAEGE